MNAQKLKKIINRIFIKHGLSNKHAETSSSYIIKAELVGAPSHGLTRLKMYCNRIKKNLINSKPKIKIKKISQSISHVDANNAIGFVGADTGIKIAIASAKKTGFGMLSCLTQADRISAPPESCEMMRTEPFWKRSTKVGRDYLFLVTKAQ